MYFRYKNVVVSVNKLSVSSVVSPQANLGCLSASGAAQYQTISPSQHSDTQTQVSTPPHLLITQSQTN